MKKNILLIFLSFSNLLIAQEIIKDELLNTIGQESCECLSKKNLDFANMENGKLEMELGLCLLESYSNHKEETNGLIDMSFEDEASLNSFGEEVGLKMVTYCPDILLSIAGDYTDDVYEQGEIIGEITKIQTSQFNTLEIIDSTSRKQKHLWLEYFEGANLLHDEQGLKNKKLKFFYLEKEFFDPQILEYRNFKVLTKIESL